jgi:hypothetical protein
MTDGVISSATSTSELVEEIRGLRRCAQVHAQAPDDVGDVPFAFAEVRILDFVEIGRELLERALQGRFRVQPLLTDDRGGAIDQHRIVEHQELRVEQVGMAAARGASHPVLDFPELLPRRGARVVEPLQLVKNERLRYAEAQRRAAFENQCPANADAG